MKEKKREMRNEKCNILQEKNDYVRSSFDSCYCYENQDKWEKIVAMKASMNN